MSSLDSLTELLQESGVSFRIYDMGRQIKNISPLDFLQIEKGLCIYPSPYLRQAWLALMIWNPKNSGQNVVWFLKFPLDEQGYLVQSVRDDFINRLMLNINQMLDSAELANAEDALRDNPFSFTPDQEKMAAFHAITLKETTAEHSQYYPLCQAYFHGIRSWDKWQDLGIQGIAEVAIYIDSNQQQIIEHFTHLQSPPLIALCHALENVVISTALATKISAKLQHSLEQQEVDIGLCCALLRAMHAAPNTEIQQQAIQQVLNSKVSNSAELLSTIAINLSTQLSKQKTLALFLERLSGSEAGQHGFSKILADLMFQENLRESIFAAFRNPTRSNQLIVAIGQMFGGKF